MKIKVEKNKPIYANRIVTLLYSTFERVPIIFYYTNCQDHQWWTLFIFIFSLLFNFSLSFIFHFLFLKQLRLGFISHAVTSVTS